MKIESLLRRKGGTKVTLDDVEYHFKPGPDGREFADVTNPDHVGIFASIREGYRVAGEKAEKEPEPEAVKESLTTDATSESADGLDKLDRVALAELYTTRFGKPPASSLGKAKLIEALRESQA